MIRINAQIFTAIAMSAFLIVMQPNNADAQTTHDSGFNPSEFSGSFVTTRPSNFDLLGSPYLSSEWGRADIVMGAGSTFENLPANFNALTGSIEVVHQADTLMMSNILVREFTITFNSNAPKTFRNRVGSKPGHFDNNTYLEVIYEGEITVFRNHIKRIRRAERGVSGYEILNNKADRVIDAERYYMRNSEGEFIEINLGRRNIQRLTRDFRNEVRDYASDNNLNFNDLHDVALILSHYERLRNSNS
jgi:hypothetical protein